MTATGLRVLAGPPATPLPGSDPPERMRIDIWPAPRSGHRVLARG